MWLERKIHLNKKRYIWSCYFLHKFFQSYKLNNFLHKFFQSYKVNFLTFIIFIHTHIYACSLWSLVEIFDSTTVFNCRRKFRWRFLTVVEGRYVTSYVWIGTKSTTMVFQKTIVEFDFPWQFSRKTIVVCGLSTTVPQKAVVVCTLCKIFFFFLHPYID